ncbi:hypothetical protein K6L44_01225 [Gluconacetobacter entanii]|uniref:hypothetical protein n=1 Tax=Gluconacetobacter entanii TaxID=108528 RepID=UPI001C93218B|nr:hypothetical protein [Gluconacetobacter entanii]MBY4638642.1 hypothetical protein [Gluconacetobacter entanii]MCW4579784.1 hypothetical protein [Gluconacetobacter entanii]MCW4583190.1 hypothetical protein [Gluconacetobacter entanii]MCW4586618.1 hypothetical protein [Gluconacetobacter entanii]
MAYRPVRDGGTTAYPFVAMSPALHFFLLFWRIFQTDFIEIPAPCLVLRHHYDAGGGSMGIRSCLKLEIQTFPGVAFSLKGDVFRSFLKKASPKTFSMFSGRSVQ